jgi:hypothetical protein
MTIAMRTPDLFKGGSIFDIGCDFFSDSSMARSSSNFACIAIDACFEIAKRSSTSEPHFVWEDHSSVTLSPSEFQLHSLMWGENEFVSIEEEDLPWRSSCVTALEALDAYAILENGWDGDEAPAPSASSLDDAHVFLRIVSSNIETCPEVIPMIDHEGIPGFVFDNDRTYISVAFYGDESITFYTIDRTTKKSMANSFSLAEAEKLADALELITSL